MPANERHPQLAITHNLTTKMTASPVRSCGGDSPCLRRLVPRIQSSSDRFKGGLRLHFNGMAATTITHLFYFR